MAASSEHLKPESTGRSLAQVVHSLLQFWRVVRSRRNFVIAAVGVSLLLGGLYYATATRIYQARASLLVLQTGGDVTNTSMTSDGMQKGLMPTYEKLFTSAVVLEAALKNLAPEDRADFALMPREGWVGALRNNLTASTARQTNIIEVVYQSKNPKASVAVVNAVLRCYLEFLDKTHKGTAGEIIDLLTKDKTQIEEKLAAKQEELLQTRRRFGDLGIRPDSTVVHPMVQRVVGLNEALIKAQQRRLELQSSLIAIQAAIRNGEDLRQHLLTMENAVGREFLLTGLGFSSSDVSLQANLEKSRLDDQADLESMQGFFGPMHPKVLAIRERMKATDKYLSEYQSRAEKKLQELQGKQLGPLLVQMVQQRLAETWQHENSLRSNFERARSDAVSYTGDLERLQIIEHDLTFLREYRDVLLTKIAGIDLKQEHGDIRTAVVSEPVLPKAAVWPRLNILVVLCLVGGLAAGLGLVYVLDTLDDRFRSPDELSGQLGVPVLAMVRQMADLHTTGLEAVQVYVAPDSVESEAFRTLRTTLAFAGRDTARLVVSSAEPGDGKTTVLSNLVASYVQAGKKTLLIDADMRRPGMTNLFACKGQRGLSDVLNSQGGIATVAAEHVRSLAEGFDFLSAGPRRPNPAELLASPRFADLLAWAETIYDQILIDSPPALAASDASIIGRLVDGLVLVVQPRKNQRKLVVRAAEMFTSAGIHLFGVVVNRVAADGADGDYNYGYGYGYGEGYHQETETDVPPTSEAPATAVSAINPADAPAAAVVGSVKGIVPRRVA